MDYEKELEIFLAKLNGWNFEVEEDPDHHEFFSVFAYKDGSGFEVAGKIGERCVANLLASTLNAVCK